MERLAAYALVIASFLRVFKKRLRIYFLSASLYNRVLVAAACLTGHRHHHHHHLIVVVVVVLLLLLLLLRWYYNVHFETSSFAG